MERIDYINENLSLIQREGGLMFGTDAYLLSAYLRGRSKKAAVELGSGTGVISLLAASRGKFEKIYAIERQSEYYSLTRRNAELNDLLHRVTPIHADIRDIKAKDVGGEVFSVFSNPPYLPDGAGFRARNPEMDAARRETAGSIYDFASCASRLLESGGLFTVVYRPDRLCDLFCAMRENSIEPKKCLFIAPHAESEPSLVIVEGKKDASPSLKVERPLIIYRSDGKTYTDRMQKIYDTGSFDA